MRRPVFAVNDGSGRRGHPQRMVDPYDCFVSLLFVRSVDPARVMSMLSRRFFHGCVEIFTAAFHFVCSASDGARWQLEHVATFRHLDDGQF